MKTLKMVTNTACRGARIKPELYGHFIEQTGRIVYDGLFVGKDSPIPNRNGIREDILEAYAELKLPLLHWPGGGVAQKYHWKSGIGSQEKRGSAINRWNYDIDDNSFGTHEFFDLCEAIGCKTYLVLNLASSTVEEIDQWLEYITFDGDTEMTRLRKANGRDKPWKLDYVAFGNEWWLYGDALGYSQLYRRHRMFAEKHRGKAHFRRALRGPHFSEYDRTAKLAELVPPGSFESMTLYHAIQGGKVTDFDEEDYYTMMRNTLRLGKDIDQHLGLLRRHEENKDVKISLDEWGTWGTDLSQDVLWYTETGMRDALAAAAELNTLNRHSSVMEMASIAMSVNALHAPLLTKGSALLKTPTFYVLEMYKEHQGAELIDCWVQDDEAAEGVQTVSASCSVKDRKYLLTLANLSYDEAVTVENTVLYHAFSSCKGRILTGDPHDKNSFEEPYRICTVPFDGFLFTPEKITVTLPPASVIALELE